MNLPEKGYKRISVIVFYIFITVAVVYLFFKYLFICVLPFAIGFLLAYATRKPVLFLRRKLKFSKLFSVITITIVILGTLGALIYFLFTRMVNEISELSEYISKDNLTSLYDMAYNTIEDLGRKYLPSLTDDILGAFENISNIFTGFLEKLFPVLAQWAIIIIKAFPDIFLFISVTLLSMFYFSYDYEKILSFIKIQFSSKHIDFLRELKEQVLVTIFKIIRAYFLLISMTFFELLTGFLLLKVKYATIIALIIAIIDILPILGTGTVLLPWSAVLLVMGDTQKGLCLLAIYVIITVVRQIAEPKILGDCVGLHPIVTLMAMYFGIKLLGVYGLVLLPFTIIIIKNLNEKNSIRLYKNPVPTQNENKKLIRKKYKLFLSNSKRREK